MVALSCDDGLHRLEEIVLLDETEVIRRSREGGLTKQQKLVIGRSRGKRRRQEVLARWQSLEA